MNLLSEEAAKARWCPFAREKYGPQTRPHHKAAFPDRCCIASECMAWRFYDHAKAWEDQEKEIDYGSSEIPPTPVFAPEGYCGLAGKP